MSAEGYFPRGGSMLRTVQEEHLVGLMFGQRALCIGACAPLNYVGTSEHSGAKLTPFRRLAHTGKAFETIFFGSRPEADRVLAYVHRMHERVTGALGQDEGVFPAGTPYAAFDVELMLWTIAVMADSALCLYELFVRRLTPDEREALWQDYLRFGELFGMPRDGCPATFAEFRAWYRAELASERMHLTEEARLIGYATAFEIPFPRGQGFGKPAHDAVILGSLPARVRELYGLPYGRREALEFRAAVGAMRAMRRLTPPPLRRGYNTRQFDGVAATERRRIAQGRPTPQVTPGGPVGIRLPAG